MSPVRDDAATMTWPACGRGFVPTGRQRYCSTTCRQRAWRTLQGAPAALPARLPGTATVYECEACGTRSLGIQRCAATPSLAGWALAGRAPTARRWSPSKTSAPQGHNRGGGSLTSLGRE